jgi:ABC-2 type transport system ATP-binding protein
MIVIDDVHKRFGKVVALAGVSLRIEPGERVALVGSNGSGKTTLLRALCGLLQVKGEIRLFGVDVHKSPQTALRALAYMPQVAPPLDAPVSELVRGYAALRRYDVGKVEGVALRLGLSLPEIARTRVRDLSGGMKQKLLAALALAAESLILVCDEPTASLDADARAAFFELVHERAAETILVLCSHRADDVGQLVGRTVQLADGKIAADSQRAELIHPSASRPPYHALAAARSIG